MNTNPTEVSAVQQEALKRAVALLKAAKLSFAIQLADGSYLGDLTVVPPKQRIRVNNFKAMFPDYISQIEAMKPGDELTWTAETPELAFSFRSAVSSNAVRFHGAKSCITVTEGNQVQVLRVE